MFDNNNKIFAYKISLKLDQYLVALFNLCYDIFIKIEKKIVTANEIIYASELFQKSFYDQLGINIDDYLEQNGAGIYLNTKEQLFDNLAANINSYYLRSNDFISKIENNNEFLYYFKDSFIIYSTLRNKKEIENSLNDKFRSINVISNIVNNLFNDSLKESIKSISTIYDLNKAGQYVKATELQKPQFLYIKAELLNFELLEEDIFDFENVWINYNHELTKGLNFDEAIDEYSIITEKVSGIKNTIGLRVNDYILLKYNVEEICLFIKEKSKNQYLWQFFKENLFRKKNQKLANDSLLVEDFKEKSKETELNQLLCNLKHNLYIDRNIEINEKYKSFFEEFILIDKLDKLSNFNFFLPDDNKEKEVLGIYSETKIGTKYHLIHYLKHKDEKHLNAFVNSHPQQIVKEKVNILKAELSFYLVEKYFEDIIEKMLQELQLDYLLNVELCIEGVPKAEFDFIIFNHNCYYFLEAKTTLNKDNVYDTSRKYNDSIDHLKKIANNDLQEFRFVLIGLLSNSNLINYKHFFDSHTVDYNVARKDFNVTPYKFNIPFFSHQNLVLQCIAEPELLKLKEFIKEICQI